MSMSSNLQKLLAPMRRPLKVSKTFDLFNVLRASRSSNVAGLNIRRHISIPQVMFNPELPYVSVPLEKQGGHLHRNIRASYPKNAHKVVAELNALFREQSELGPSKGHEWIGFSLESSCDAISRSIFLSEKEQVVFVANDILRVAEELNHHPSITASGREGAPWLLIATCMTHHPAGLSVKDPRLARRINEIVLRLEILQEVGQTKTVALGHESQIHSTRLWHWQKNIGRAQPQLDIAEDDGSDSDEEGENVPFHGLHFWALNNANDIQNFSEQKEAALEDVPTMRRLLP